MINNIDKKFKKIGFNKIEDNNYIVVYERENKLHNYVQVLELSHKANGKHIMQSYDKGLMDIKKIGNTCVGLTYYEMKLAMKKMKKKGWK